jgi:hypothetical protein
MRKFNLIPKSKVKVKGYRKSNGTIVKSYVRMSPQDRFVRKYLYKRK